MNEADRLATLHKQIQEFDRVLAGMQDVLSGFQNQLGNISGEINSLQEQSVKMNQKLKNRKIAKGQLGEFIEAVVLPPDFIKSIYTMDVTNEGYGNLLNMLSKKRIQLSKLVQSKASAEAAPNLNELTLEAVAKVYKFLQDLIVELQTPKTNIQIKQSYLRKYRPLMQFLDEQDPKTALEIRNNYTNVLGGVIFSILIDFFLFMRIDLL
jgi:aromatic ring-cleaving dioxygenase